MRIFGVGTALLGVFWSIFARDTKRTLAFSTISQLGFLMAAPTVAGFYALTHGLAKSAMFLITGVLPSRDFENLRKQGIDRRIWIPLVIASCSISGFPLLSGFGAKVLTTKNLLPWQSILMNIAASGTAVVFTKFIFLPNSKLYENYDKGNKRKVHCSFWLSMLVLIGGLVVANFFYPEAYTIGNIIKSLIIIGIGWLLYWLFFKKLFLRLPSVAEELEYLIGTMSIILIITFWMILTID